MKKQRFDNIKEPELCFLFPESVLIDVVTKGTGIYFEVLREQSGPYIGTGKLLFSEGFFKNSACLTIELFISVCSDFSGKLAMKRREVVFGVTNYCLVGSR